MGELLIAVLRQPDGRARAVLNELGVRPEAAHAALRKHYDVMPERGPTARPRQHAARPDPGAH